MEVSKSEIIEIIKKANPNIDIETFDHDVQFEDIGIDSLDMANILFQIDEKYGINIPDEDIPEIQTINAIHEYLNNAMALSAEKSY